MSLPVEKFISNFVQNQFPSFYEKEGPNFILFLQAYYEWLEKDGNVIAEARNLFEYRDIDTTPSNTIQDFLVYFQKKYLYGIPYSIISNKKFLLKHILDIYRSKGTDRCYELLFRLIYNEDIEIYRPSYDMLKVSDGTWIEPKYIEVTNSPVLNSLRGVQVVGTISNTVGMVESVNIEPLNNNITCSLYISNIIPKGADFVIGESIINYANNAAYNIFEAPEVIGSTANVTIINGGDGFNVGDILSIASFDPTTGKPVSYGVGGKLKVTKTSRSQGTLEYYIIESGAGITPNTSIYFYKALGDNSGYGASFNLGPLSFVKNYTYNTDLIYDYKDTVFNATTYNFPGDPSGNGSIGLVTGGYAIYDLLSYSNNNFGSVYSLTNINPGNNYIYSPEIFLRSSLVSKPINIGTISYNNANIYVLELGTISYNTTSNTITGTSTTFSNIFANGDVIGIQTANTGGIQEYHVIYTVNSNTSITLTDKPVNNSTPFSKYYKVPYVVGTGTGFTSLYNANDVIGLQANSANATTLEFQVIQKVVNDSLIILYGSPNNKSTSTAEYFITPSLMRSQFALYEPPMYMTDGTVPGENSFIGAIPNNGNNIVSQAIAYDSGKGYLQGETINAYLYDGITTPEVVLGGTGYANGEQLVFTGGTTSVQANGFIQTNTSGGIVQCTLINMGANYTYPPIISVATAHGVGANLVSSLAPPTMLNTYSKITGKINKKGVGVSPGYWSTTRGFLNSDKYIQDSYFYQDYSYQIRAASVLDKYKQIIYNTFHSSGMELFGDYFNVDSVASRQSLVAEIYEKVHEVFFSVDTTNFTVDNGLITADEYYLNVTMDETDFSIDNVFLTADATYLSY